MTFGIGFVAGAIFALYAAGFIVIAVDEYRAWRDPFQ